MDARKDPLLTYMVERWNRKVERLIGWMRYEEHMLNRWKINQERKRLKRAREQKSSPGRDKET